MIQAEYRKSGLVLNKLQADFMLLIAMGNSNDEIMEYLKIDQKQLSYLKFVIKVKFKTRDWKLTVIKALEEGFIDLSDLTHDIARDTAYEYARKFYKSKFGAVINFIPQSSIEQFVLDFYNSCETTFSEQGSSIVLSSLQKKFLWLQIKAAPCQEIKDRLHISTLEYLTLKQSILNTYNTSNMFGAIRKAFQYNNINKSPFLLPTLTSEIKECAQAIARLNFDLKSHSKQEFMIYDELIKFYLSIERKYLLFHFKNNKKIDFKISA